jgi:hypothetical protein
MALSDEVQARLDLLDKLLRENLRTFEGIADAWPTVQAEYRSRAAAGDTEVLAELDRHIGRGEAFRALLDYRPGLEDLGGVRSAL